MDEFQKKNIRYIAIHDNIDTSKGVDDFMPLHDVFNEFHAKNTSKKIRAVVQAKADTLQADLSDLEQESVNVDRFLAVVRKYTEVKELTPAIIHEFIDKIIIHQPDSPHKNRVQKVEIIYNNIGMFDLSALEQGQAV